MSQRFEQLSALDRLREMLGYKETLDRGYAVVRCRGKVIKSVTSAKSAATLEVEFRDGRFEIKSQKNVFTQSKDSGSDQGSLF